MLQILFVFITLLGAILAPNADLSDGYACLEIETPYICAVEFADHIAPHIQQILIVGSLENVWFLHYIQPPYNDHTLENVFGLLLSGNLG